MLLYTLCPAEDLPRWTNKFLVSYLHGDKSPGSTRSRPCQWSMLHLATASPDAPNQPVAKETRFLVQLSGNAIHSVKVIHFEANVDRWRIMCQSTEQVCMRSMCDSTKTDKAVGRDRPQTLCDECHGPAARQQHKVNPQGHLVQSL